MYNIFKRTIFTKSTSITNYKVLLVSLFIILPIADAINGFLVVKGVISEAGIASPSQLGRLFVSVLLVYLLTIKKLGVLPAFLFLYFLSVEVVSGLYHNNSYGFTYGVVSAYKLGYLILVTIVLNHYTKTEKGMKQLALYLKYNIFIIALLLYFSIFTGIGNSTYGHGFGTKSFFASGNGLGLYLGVGVLILIGFKRYNLLSINNSSLFFLALSIAFIGSKTALVLCLVNIIFMVSLSKYRMLFIILFSLLMITFLPQIIESFNVIFDVIIKRLNSSDNILLYLASGRLDYVLDAFSTFFKTEPSVYRYFFGMGAFTSFQNPYSVVKFDTLETDVFDLLFMYGLLASAFFVFVNVFILLKLRKYKIFFFGMLLLTLHSAIAGHVLFNGMSSITFALFICISNFLASSVGSYDKKHS